VLVMVTGYARWLTAWLLPSRVAEDLFAGWWQLISQLGRLPRVLVWNGEGAVGQRRRRTTVLTQATHAFRGVLGAKVVICDPGDPEAKGLVERANGYLETSFLPGRTFVSPDDFNAQLADWLVLPTGGGVGCWAAHPPWSEDRRLSVTPAREGALCWPTGSSRWAVGHSIMSTCSTRLPSASVVIKRWTCAPDAGRFAFGSVPGAGGGAKSALESIVLIDPSLLRNGMPSGPPTGIRLGSLLMFTVPSGLTQGGLGGAVLLWLAALCDPEPVDPELAAVFIRNTTPPTNATVIAATACFVYLMTERLPSS